MILIDTKNYGILKFTENDIEKFNNYYLINASDNDGYIYSGITDSNYQEIRLNKYTLFNDIQKVLIPYNIIVSKETNNNINNYYSYTLNNNEFIHINKPSSYILDNINNNSNYHVKHIELIKDKCMILETNFYYYPIVKLLSYSDVYKDLTFIDENSESYILFNNFNKNNYKKIRKSLIKK